MAHHFNYRSTRTIWFSKIDKIFSCKIALEINNRPGYYSRQYGMYVIYCVLDYVHICNLRDERELEMELGNLKREDLARRITENR